jgi:NADH-quinone oxidoreductase subunit J
MAAIFYVSSAVAVVATIFTITRRNAIHALLYLIVSLLAIAIDFYVMGAAFVAALELIIYAGAIMVLFVFVVMMLNIGEHAGETELDIFRVRAWAGPAILALILLGEVDSLVFGPGAAPTAYLNATEISSKQVAVALFGPYVIGVELASLLLTAGLVGAYHLGRGAISREEDLRGIDTDESRAVSRDSAVSAGVGRSTHAA